MSKPRHPKRPVSKATKRLLESLRRKSGIRDLAPRVLIVCEDEKSSPNYFHALKREFRLSATIVGSGHFSQPIQVVERARQRKQSAADEDAPFDSVWCVIDGDYGIRINNARACAQANGIELAISTQCFEYWIVLHFEESAAPTGVLREWLWTNGAIEASL
jgi:hypothetical protein